MYDEALTRWQRGWSAARGWTDVQWVDDVTVVRIGEPGHWVEYIATQQHAPAAAHLALTDCNPPGSSWLTIAAAVPHTPTAHLTASPEGRALYTSLGWTTLTPLLIARTSVTSAR